MWPGGVPLPAWRWVTNKPTGPFQQVKNPVKEIKTGVCEGHDWACRFLPVRIKEGFSEEASLSCDPGSEKTWAESFLDRG